MILLPSTNQSSNPILNVVLKYEDSKNCEMFDQTLTFLVQGSIKRLNGNEKSFLNLNKNQGYIDNNNKTGSIMNFCIALLLASFAYAVNCKKTLFIFYSYKA